MLLELEEVVKEVSDSSFGKGMPSRRSSISSWVLLFERVMKLWLGRELGVGEVERKGLEACFLGLEETGAGEVVLKRRISRSSRLRASSI